MYKSTLKQESTKPLDLNYSKYLDFDNIVIWDKSQASYTTTQKCMVFGTSIIAYKNDSTLYINNNAVLSGDYNIKHFSIDTLAVNAGTVFTRREYPYESFKNIYFVPFIDQTIIVPDFSKMTDLSNMLSYNVTKDGILLGKIINGPPTDINITNYNKSILAGYGSSCIKYVAKGMTITNSVGERYKLTNWYYIPMEE